MFDQSVGIWSWLFAAAGMVAMVIRDSRRTRTKDPASAGGPERGLLFQDMLASDSGRDTHAGRGGR